MSSFDIIALLILMSGIFLFINTYVLKLPSSIGLIIMALLLSGVVMLIGSIHPDYHLAEAVKKIDMEEILYRFVLSVMIYAGALSVDFTKMDKQLVPIVVLAIFGVLISSFVIAYLVYLVVGVLDIGLDFRGCLVFGALISSTDPVAITKTIRRFSLSKALEEKISGEAMLNGVIAIALAMIVVRMNQQEAASGVPMDVSDTTILVVQNVGGGLVLGFVFGWIGQKLLKFVDNDSVEVEVLITIAMVMTGSLVAHKLFVSPIIVAMMQGLMVSNYGKEADEEAALGKYVYRFWQLLQDSLAAMLFVLIGFEMLVIPLRIDYFALGFFSIVIVLFARWISVFIPIRLLAMSHNFEKGTISVLTWGALRGGLPVALSLSIPDYPGHEIIITITYVVVVCSVLFQGLTLGALMRSVRSSNKALLA